MKPLFRRVRVAIAAVVVFLPTVLISQLAPPSSEVPNLADPEAHPYADPAQGRERFSYSSAKVNEFRLYDFYARQADYYASQPELPEILPAFPGMEAGRFGHWGKYSQFDYFDESWSRMDNGSLVGSVIRFNREPITKAVNLRLSSDGALSTTFDPLALNYRMVWTGGFLKYGSIRWGMMSNVQSASAPQFTSGGGNAWGETAETEYLGYYRFNDEVVFSYTVDNQPILDQPGSLSAGNVRVFTRTLQFPKGISDGSLSLFNLPSGAERISVESAPSTRTTLFSIENERIGFVIKSSSVSFSDTTETELSAAFNAEAGAAARIYIWKASSDLDSQVREAIEADAISNPLDYTSGGPAQWPNEYTQSGTLGSGEGPYVVDILPTPLENEWDSPMFLSGVSFFENGDAAVATFFGDIWIVTGIDDTLESVTWKRFAQGLNQPLGLEVVDDVVYAICRDQITKLHDLNGDGEADYFENFCNRFPSSAGGHDYNTGLQRDGEGNFYFATKHAGVFRVSADGKEVETLAAGFRNPNGIGVDPDGTVYTTPQEGQWNPASMIIQVHMGEFYGHGKHIVNRGIDRPLCFVPRGIDNSTGGQLVVTSDGWGPLKDHLLSFSFGDCTQYLVLKDDSDGRPQGAVVPLQGEFLSGIHRGRFHPKDQQLYVVGSQGWGNYSQVPGSFERVRYTGEPLRYPIGYKVYKNGIRVDFDLPLSRANTQSINEHFFAQAWNYQYSKGYGSPEFSVRHPGVMGHDPLPVSSAHLLNDGHSIFVEIPDLAPAMQAHLRMRLEFADGERFDTELFPTIYQQAPPFLEIEDPAPIIADKPSELEMPSLDVEGLATADTSDDTHGRSIVLSAVTGLAYDKTRISASPGERLSLTLKNEDVMPHNWVLVRWEGYTKVGRLADQMISDPLAIQKQYIPESNQIVAHTIVVNPGESHTVHFNAPTSAGKYPFLCTYPGHWQVMRGVLLVH